MQKQRTDRLNSLLKEVISEVIRIDVRHPDVHRLLTVTRVDITKDLHYAKVYISVIGTSEEKAKTLKALQSAAGFIAVNASKKVVMRYFPALTFKLDDGVEKHMRIEELLSEISAKRTIAENESAPELSSEQSDDSDDSEDDFDDEDDFEDDEDDFEDEDEDDEDDFEDDEDEQEEKDGKH